MEHGRKVRATEVQCFASVGTLVHLWIEGFLEGASGETVKMSEPCYLRQEIRFSVEIAIFII